MTIFNKSIEKLYSSLVQLSANEVEKRKIINNLIEILPRIRSKNCCLAVLNILVEYSKEGFFDHVNLISLLLNLINTKQEK